jgi:hypothetical protein
MEKNIAFLELHFFLCIILIFFPGCVHRKQIDKQKLLITQPIAKNSTPSPDTAPMITIWVHGTLMFRKPSYHLIFGENPRLIPIASLPKDHHFHILARTATEHDSEHFPLEEFYIFSWSGKLHSQERKDAAKKLYQEIITLCQTYQKKYGCDPIIRIISHSHGGNVVLNMAKIDITPPPFQIQTLILLACPVQEKTKHLIKTTMFQRVYSLYSGLDMIQVLAPQFKRTCTAHCTNPKHKRHYHIPLFSSRLFPHYNHLTQAKVKINDLPISHTRFSTKEFIALLPTIINKLDSWHTDSLANDKIDKYKLLCIYKKNQNC